MNRFTLLATLTVLALGAFVMYTRYLDQRADREFGAQADLVRQNVTNSATTYSRLSGRKKSDWVPPWEPKNYDEWKARNTRVDANAQQAALQLRTVQKRELALRWLGAERRLRETLVKEQNVIAWYRFESDMCDRSPALRLPTPLNPKERVEYLTICRQRASQGYERQLQPLRADYGRFEDEATALWAKLVAITPAIGQP